MSFERIDPPGLAQPVGYGHLVVLDGPLVVVAGQTSQGPDGRIRGVSVVEQMGYALDNVVLGLQAGGSSLDRIVKAVIYCSRPDQYVSNLGTPGVTKLFNPAALIEIEVIAVA